MSSPLEDVEQDVDAGNTSEPENTPSPSQEETSESDGVLSYLTASTGDGGLEEYQDTPLNPNNDEGLAQIIRGLSGLASRKVDDFAVLDIGLGAFKFLNQDNDSEGGESSAEATEVDPAEA